MTPRRLFALLALTLLCAASVAVAQQPTRVYLPLIRSGAVDPCVALYGPGYLSLPGDPGFFSCVWRKP